MIPCSLRPLKKQIATTRTSNRPETIRASQPSESVPVSSGLTPITTRPIAAAAITVASIELRPSSAQ
jgi:hypothetical protein